MKFIELITRALWNEHEGWGPEEYYEHTELSEDDFNNIKDNLERDTADFSWVVDACRYQNKSEAKEYMWTISLHQIEDTQNYEDCSPETLIIDSCAIQSEVLRAIANQNDAADD